MAAEVVASTARFGHLLTLQTDEHRRNIEDATAAGAKPYQTNDAVEIPAPAVLALARKL